MSNYIEINSYIMDYMDQFKKERKKLHRPGIEPGPPAWQASILPLNQRCFFVKKALNFRDYKTQFPDWCDSRTMQLPFFGFFIFAIVTKQVLGQFLGSFGGFKPFFHALLSGCVKVIHIAPILNSNANSIIAVS